MDISCGSTRKEDYRVRDVVSVTSHFPPWRVGGYTSGQVVFAEDGAPRLLSRARSITPVPREAVFGSMGQAIRT